MPVAHADQSLVAYSNPAAKGRKKPRSSATLPFILSERVFLARTRRGGLRAAADEGGGRREEEEGRGW